MKPKKQPISSSPKRKRWHEARVELPSAHSEAAANFLIERGSPGVAQDEAKGPEGQRWDRLTAYYDRDRSWAARNKKIRSYLQKLSPGLFRLQCRLIREEGWAETWKVNFKTRHITDRIVVRPPWEEYESRPDELVLTIDPGMAFGTGTHPTTQMCLQELERRIPALGHPSVFDVGTGSGILAIAARRLRAGKILAVDIDPVAIENAVKNARANRVRGISFRAGSLAGMRRRFDIVVANLLPQEILSLVPGLAARVSPGGSLILSGLLRRQQKEIVSAFTPWGFAVSRSEGKKGWACLVLDRKQNRGAAGR